MKERWLIAVGSWGVSDKMMTESEAEEWRCHKANWEHSPAIKMRYADFLKLSKEDIEMNWAYKMMRSALHLEDQLDGEEEKTPTPAEVGYIPKQQRLTYAPGCSHQCSGNCRRVGCNCACGEFHGYYESEN